MVLRVIQISFSVVSMIVMVAFLTSDAWAGGVLFPPEEVDVYSPPWITSNREILVTWSTPEDYRAVTSYTVQWRKDMCPTKDAYDFTTLDGLPKGVWHALSWNGVKSGDQWTPYIWLPDDGLVKGSAGSLQEAQNWVERTVYRYRKWQGADEVQTDQTSYIITGLKPSSRYAVRVRASGRHGHSVWTLPQQVETAGFDHRSTFCTKTPPLGELFKAIDNVYPPVGELSPLTLQKRLLCRLRLVRLAC